ncbi:MAG TPA: general secretion pathway protein GspB [Steroidobacteraceae bacterium]|nr:general secretion pathway protein GspB [Steroidobacteraceae bacterium]
MSFILDALRKSEHARQSLSNTSMAELPLGRRPRGQPWWIFAIAALLLVNLIVLTIILFRDSTTKTAATQPVATAQPAPTLVQSSSPTTPTVTMPATRPLSEEASPPQVQYETVTRSEVPVAANPADGPALVKRSDTPPAAGSVVMETATGLPELHIDMHVYAKQPADRFVFINMHKYTEGQTLVEGPRVDEITADGVVLNYKGQQLRLVRP